MALELQPKEVKLDTGELFKDVKHKSKPVTLKMTMAGILLLDPVTNVSATTHLSDNTAFSALALSACVF